MDSQPPISWSADNGTPDWTSQLAQVCLKSWNRKFSMPALRNPVFQAVLWLILILLTLAVGVPSDLCHASVWTNTKRWCFPICSLNTLQAVLFRATPIAFPPFASSGWIQARSICDHSRWSMFERLNTVANTKITTGLNISGIYDRLSEVDQALSLIINA